MSAVSNLEVKMKRFILCTICLCLLSSCAYYSQTAIEVSASKIKAVIPAGAVPLPAEGEKPKAWLVRKMYFSVWKKDEVSDVFESR